jgi:hypothetical protein
MADAKENTGAKLATTNAHAKPKMATVPKPISKRSTINQRTY